MHLFWVVCSFFLKFCVRFGKDLGKILESATAFVEKCVPLSILNTYDDSIAAKCIRNINDAKKGTAVVRSFWWGGMFL